MSNYFPTKTSALPWADTLCPVGLEMSHSEAFLFFFLGNTEEAQWCFPLGHCKIHEKVIWLTGTHNWWIPSMRKHHKLDSNCHKCCCTSTWAVHEKSAPPFLWGPHTPKTSLWSPELLLNFTGSVVKLLHLQATLLRLFPVSHPPTVFSAVSNILMHIKLSHEGKQTLPLIW